MPKHKHADLIKAWADGAEIEYHSLAGEGWVRTSNPAWYETTEYRIKPEPKPDKIVIQPHAKLLSDGPILTYTYCQVEGTQQVKWTIDGETGRIKSVELLDK